MKKINIVCILCILWELVGIALNILCLCNNWSPIYNLILLIVNSTLVGFILGICVLSNIIVKNSCNFDREGVNK